jgi:hypothetical protein
MAKSTNRKSKTTPAPKSPPARGRNKDYRKVGPTSIEGVEASDLPDKGRGPVETNMGKEARRNIPNRTGGVIGGEVGMRGMPDVTEADARGGRKRN